MADAATLTGSTGKVLGNLQLKTVMLDKGAIVNLVSATASETIETVRQLVTGMYTIKGNIASSTEWSGVTSPTAGDVYNMGYSGQLESGTYDTTGSWDGSFRAGDNLVYTSSGWDKLAGSVDTSSFVASVTAGSGIDVSRTQGSSEVTVALDAATQASLALADGSIQGVKLAGAASNLSPSGGVVTIPNAVATGTGETNGLLTAADKTKIDNIPQAGTATPAMDSGAGSAGPATTFSKSDHVHPTDTSRAPVDHKSTATTYGAADGTNYGHVKLSDSISDSTVAAASGATAATPKAVYDALAAAKSYADGVTPDLTSRIKKATVLTNLNTPPAEPTLPSGYDELTVNQVLYAMYAGASENESGS